jgi:flavin-dependent dehydrogenase
MDSATITVLEGNERREVMRRGGDTGYILERRVFDRALAEAAASAGARVLTETPVIGLLRESGRLAGVRVSWRGETTAVAARVVIAADGVESQVARWASILTPHAVPISWARRPPLAATFGSFSRARIGPNWASASNPT